MNRGSRDCSADTIPEGQRWGGMNLAKRAWLQTRQEVGCKGFMVLHAYYSMYLRCVLTATTVLTQRRGTDLLHPLVLLQLLVLSACKPLRVVMVDVMMMPKVGWWWIMR